MDQYRKLRVFLRLFGIIYQTRTILGLQILNVILIHSDWFSES